MGREAVLWMDAAGDADPNGGPVLTALDELASGVVNPVLERYGGRTIQAGGGVAVAFRDMASAVAAIEDVVAATREGTIEVRAVATEDAEKDGTDLFDIVGDSRAAVLLADPQPAPPGDGWVDSGHVQRDGEDAPLRVFRLTGTRVGDASGRRRHWRRALTALPLGGVGFAGAAVVRRAQPDAAPEPVPAEAEASDPVVPGAPAAAPVEPEPAAFVPPRVTAATAAQQELADEALARFERLGLELPSDLIVNFHEPEDYAACGGHVGLATHGDDFEQIDLCTENAFTLYHELAHMWAEETLTDDAREAFVELRGLEVWRGLPEGVDTPNVRTHALQGTEHAADVIAWGVMEGAVRPTGIPGNDDESLADAFAVLTGFAAPHLAPASAPDDPLGIGDVSLFDEGAVGLPSAELETADIEAEPGDIDLAGEPEAYSDAAWALDPDLEADQDVLGSFADGFASDDIGADDAATDPLPDDDLGPEAL